MAPVVPDQLPQTRQGLHRVVEHVLAAALKRATGQVALQPLPGGLGTPRLPSGKVLALMGTDMVVDRRGEVRRQRLTTVRAAAEFAGVEPGFPWTKHPPATPFEPDAPLAVDSASARMLTDWFELGDVALSRLVADLGDLEPTPALLFPEHFDLGMVADKVNYGFSPGDALIGLPYAYVGPHTGPPAHDRFWNAEFGAYRTVEDIVSVDDAMAFFADARARLTASRR